MPEEPLQMNLCNVTISYSSKFLLYIFCFFSLNLNHPGFFFTAQVNSIRLGSLESKTA